MHIEGSAAAGVGVPGALGEQTHWDCRFDGARSRADESVERARLAYLARLSVALAKARALIFQEIAGEKRRSGSQSHCFSRAMATTK